MGRNTGKVVLLTIPCMVTLGLLIYCLISQQWVEVDEQRLSSITETFEREFDAYENRTSTRWSSSSSRVGPLVSKSSSNERTTSPTTTTTTTETTTTTPTTTTVASTAGTAADPDYTAEDYEDDENQDENGVQRKRDLSSSSANLFERRTLKVNKQVDNNSLYKIDI